VVAGIVVICLAVVIVCLLRRDRGKPVDFTPLLNDLINSEGLRIEKATTPRELKKRFLTFLSELGNGHYGVVTKGLYSEPGEPDLPVAIKAPKSHLNRESAAFAREELLRESACHFQLRHPNVVTLVGVVSRGDNVLLVAELCEKGSLDKFLQQRTGHIHRLSTAAMLHIALDVANGLEYLHSLNFVHRDLAARNVLISATDVCKVGSLFHLCPCLNSSMMVQYYAMKGCDVSSYCCHTVAHTPHKSVRSHCLALYL
jgi:serine/threonine protein kinase